MEKVTVHRLRHTDTLEALSAMYHVPVCMIMRANELKTECRLSELRELKIPPRCHCNRCGETETAYTNYIVRPEDTLYGIARKHGLTMRILLKDNGMQDPEDIKPGDMLRVPRLSGEIWCVREGESLDDIARRKGITAGRIRQVNRMDSCEQAWPGMLLLIPKD
jgi:LysM repeat protein